jgi:hypothetical protein
MQFQYTPEFLLLIVHGNNSHCVHYFDSDLRKKDTQNFKNQNEKGHSYVSNVPGNAEHQSENYTCFDVCCICCNFFMRKSYQTYKDISCE